MQLHRGNLFLVGMPGSGKSTLGRLLAKRLDKRFYDADVELERRLGVSIPVIFELEGEPGFRDREEAMLAELVVQHTNVVLATGGGVDTAASQPRASQAKWNGALPACNAGNAVGAHAPQQAPAAAASSRIHFSALKELYVDARSALSRESRTSSSNPDQEQVIRLAQRLEQQLRAAARAE